MSTDIFPRFEIRPDGVWEPVELLPELNAETATDEEFTAYGNHPAYIDRNYVLCAVLANFRNTFGLTPISSPRGLPKDVSPQVRSDFIGPYGPGPSWVTLDELLNYNWDQIVTDSRHPDAKPESCREAVEPFLSRNLPYLLAQVENSADFRIVFDFG